MNNQRYRNENATPRDRIPRMMMNAGFEEKSVGEETPAAIFAGDVPLAMAYVPDRKWGEVYDLETAFPKGTIFPELDFPFVGCVNGRMAR